MPSIIYDINGNDWGLGMDLPGKKLEIIMKNINPLVDARIVKGYILNNIPFNSSVVNAPFSGVELAIMCLPVSQNYNGVHNSYTATYDIPYPNTSINGVPLSTFNGYNLNHRFVKNFTLRPFSAYGDHFVFDVFFFFGFAGAGGGTSIRAVSPQSGERPSRKLLNASAPMRRFKSASRPETILCAALRKSCAS